MKTNGGKDAVVEDKHCGKTTRGRTADECWTGSSREGQRVAQRSERAGGTRDGKAICEEKKEGKGIKNSVRRENKDSREKEEAP